MDKLLRYVETNYYYNGIHPSTYWPYAETTRELHMDWQNFRKGILSWDILRILHMYFGYPNFIIFRKKYKKKNPEDEAFVILL